MAMSFRSLCCSVVIVIFALTLGARGQVGNSGTVKGTVTDPSGAVIPDARVRLNSTRSAYDRTISTDGEGQYRFSGVPQGQFSLHVEAPGFTPADFTGEIHSNATVLHSIQFKGATAVQQITVTDSYPAVGSASTHFDFEDEQLKMRPLESPNRDLPAVVEMVPGVVPEENGRMHVRGAESQPQYVLDGVPFAENMTSTFATAPDAENLRSTQVITGNIPAEYGERLAAVVNMTSKSGLDMPWNGSLSLSGGSFDSGAMDAEVGGHVKNVGVFLSADTSRSRRYLDPPEIGNFHNRGGLAHLFTRLDWSPSTQDAFRLTLAMNGSNFQVPNREEQQGEGQNLRQELRDDFQALNWIHTFNNSTSSEVTLFRRSSTARLLDPALTGTPLFLDQNRRQRSEGIRAALTRSWANHLLKAGVAFRRAPLNERFALAVTDPEDAAEDVDPESPIFQFTLADPFRFSEKRTGVFASAFIEDQMKLGAHWTLDLGLRLDHPDLIVHDNALSPRIGVAYRILRTNTVLHASYNRLYGIPPLENLLLASSPAAARLQDEPAEGQKRAEAFAEKQNHYEFGFQQRVGRYFRFSAVRYVKNVKNFVDDAQLFDTAIVFPVALAAADIRGTEIRLDLTSLTGWSGYLSYANGRATVTAPLVAGLLIEDEDEFAQAGKQFASDSDERNEVQLGFTYSHKSGFWGAFDTRYDSGIPTELEGSEFATLDPRIQRQIDPVRHRIKPRTLINIAAGKEFFRESRFPIELRAGVNNLLDRFYLYNFESVFSGTHIGRPRELIVRATFHWRSK